MAGSSSRLGPVMSIRWFPAPRFVRVVGRARTCLQRAADQPSADTFLELRTDGGDFVAIGKSGAPASPPATVGATVGPHGAL